MRNKNYNFNPNQAKQRTPLRSSLISYVSKKFNYHIGNLFKIFGYKIIRDYKDPKCTLNIVEIGIKLIQSNKTSLTIIQIGAFDGDLSDPLKPVLNNSKNKVVLIEPQQRPFQILEQAYSAHTNISLENSAIAETDGTIQMFLPQDEEYSPKASIYHEHMKNFEIRDSKAILVNSISVLSLIQKYEIETVDVLQIDAEGFDFKILKSFFDANIESTIINLETLHLQKDERLALRIELEKRKYRFIEYGIDIFAMKSEFLAHK